MLLDKTNPDVKHINSRKYSSPQALAIANKIDMVDEIAIVKENMRGSLNLSKANKSNSGTSEEANYEYTNSDVMYKVPIITDPKVIMLEKEVSKLNSNLSGKNWANDEKKRKIKMLSYMYPQDAERMQQIDPKDPIEKMNEHLRLDTKYLIHSGKLSEVVMLKKTLYKQSLDSLPKKQKTSEILKKEENPLDFLAHSMNMNMDTLDVGLGGDERKGFDDMSKNHFKMKQLEVEQLIRSDFGETHKFFDHGNEIEFLQVLYGKREVDNMLTLIKNKTFKIKNMISSKDKKNLYGEQIKLTSLNKNSDLFKETTYKFQFDLLLIEQLVIEQDFDLYKPIHIKETLYTKNNQEEQLKVPTTNEPNKILETRKRSSIFLDCVQMQSQKIKTVLTKDNKSSRNNSAKSSNHSKENSSKGTTFNSKKDSARHSRQNSESHHSRKKSSPKHSGRVSLNTKAILGAKVNKSDKKLAFSEQKEIEKSAKRNGSICDSRISNYDQPFPESAKNIFVLSPQDKPKENSILKNLFTNLQKKGSLMLENSNDTFSIPSATRKSDLGGSISSSKINYIAPLRISDKSEEITQKDEGYDIELLKSQSILFGDHSQANLSFPAKSKIDSEIVTQTKEPAQSYLPEIDSKPTPSELVINKKFIRKSTTNFTVSRDQFMKNLKTSKSALPTKTSMNFLNMFKNSIINLANVKGLSGKSDSILEKKNDIKNIVKKNETKNNDNPIQMKAFQHGVLHHLKEVLLDYPSVEVNEDFKQVIRQGYGVFSTDLLMSKTTDYLISLKNEIASKKRVNLSSQYNEVFNGLKKINKRNSLKQIAANSKTERKLSISVGNKDYEILKAAKEFNEHVIADDMFKKDKDKRRRDTFFNQPNGTMGRHLLLIGGSNVTENTKEMIRSKIAGKTAFHQNNWAENKELPRNNLEKIYESPMNVDYDEEKSEDLEHSVDQNTLQTNTSNDMLANDIGCLTSARSQKNNGFLSSSLFKNNNNDQLLNKNEGHTTMRVIKDKFHNNSVIQNGFRVNSKNNVLNRRVQSIGGTKQNPKTEPKAVTYETSETLKTQTYRTPKEKSYMQLNTYKTPDSKSVIDPQNSEFFKQMKSDRGGQNSSIRVNPISVKNNLFTEGNESNDRFSRKNGSLGHSPVYKTNEDFFTQQKSARKKINSFRSIRMKMKPLGDLLTGDQRDADKKIVKIFNEACKAKKELYQKKIYKKMNTALGKVESEFNNLK